MFYAVSTRTMASAKPYVPSDGLDDVVVVNLIEEKLRRRQEAARLAEEVAARNAAIIAEQRRVANEAIKAANDRLSKFRDLGVFTESVASVIRRLSRATGVSINDIMGDGKSQRVALVRQAVYYWLCRRTLRSMAEIARMMDRDHTSIRFGKNSYVKKRAAMGRTLRPVR